jgi:hypothetical protein
MEESRKNPYAFPYKDDDYHQNGMTVHDYFMAHAPRDASWEFEPEGLRKMPEGEHVVGMLGELTKWNAEKMKLKAIQWPRVWADEMIKQRQNKIA